MPLKPKTIGKLYWTIGEVAEELGVNTSSIRFWEKEFGTIIPKRTNRGDRLYTTKEIDQLRTIQRLVKEEGFTLNGAKSQMKQGAVAKEPVPAADHEAIRERLLAIRRSLVELRNALGGEPASPQQ